MRMRRFGQLFWQVVPAPAQVLISRERLSEHFRSEALYRNPVRKPHIGRLISSRKRKGVGFVSISEVQEYFSLKLRNIPTQAIQETPLATNWSVMPNTFNPP